MKNQNIEKSIIEYIGDCLITEPEDVVLNLNRISPNLKDIVKNYLSVLCENTPNEVLAMSVLAMVAETVSINRVKISSSLIQPAGKTTFPNIYILNFMPSGSGKDKPLNIIKGHLMKDVNYEFIKKVNEYFEKEEENIKHEAEDKFQKAQSRKEMYIEEHRPRELVLEIADGTFEGLLALRAAFYKAEFGGVFVKISEFGDFILSENKSRIDFLQSLAHMFEFGDSEAKITKAEKNTVPIYGVPTNLLAHTSPNGLLHGEGKEKLMSFLQRGLIRRSYICFPVIPKALIEEKDIVNRIFEKREELKKANAKDRGYQNMFYDVYKAAEETQEWAFHEDADLYLEIYKEYNRIQADKQDVDAVPESYIAEMGNRWWKAMKLAALIAIFEHPNERRVLYTDVKTSIYITEVLGKQFQRFFLYEEKPAFFALFQYFLKNKDRWINKSELMQQNFVSQRNFSQWLKDSEEMIAELAVDRGYKFEAGKNGSIGRRFRLIDLNPIK